jgi:hypothetical protein
VLGKTGINVNEAARSLSYIRYFDRHYIIIRDQRQLIQSTDDKIFNLVPKLTAKRGNEIAKI